MRRTIFATLMWAISGLVILQKMQPEPMAKSLEDILTIGSNRLSTYTDTLRTRAGQRRRLEASIVEFALSRNKIKSWAEEFKESVMAVATETNIDPNWILSIISVENNRLDANVENWYGAVGLTQVVGRLHWGEYPECGNVSLTDVYTNLCYGMRIFLYKLAGCNDNVTCALWNYNGCTKDMRINGENCVTYPNRVQKFYSELTED